MGAGCQAVGRGHGQQSMLGTEKPSTSKTSSRKQLLQSSCATVNAWPSADMDGRLLSSMPCGGQASKLQSIVASRCSCDTDGPSNHATDTQIPCALRDGMAVSSDWIPGTSSHSGGAGELGATHDAHSSTGDFGQFNGRCCWELLRARRHFPHHWRRLHFR